eukprot:2528420-Rhodomonas_salina.1
MALLELLTALRSSEKSTGFGLTLHIPAQLSDPPSNLDAGKVVPSHYVHDPRCVTPGARPPHNRLVLHGRGHCASTLPPRTPLTTALGLQFAAIESALRPLLGRPLLGRIVPLPRRPSDTSRPSHPTAENLRSTCGSRPSSLTPRLMPRIPLGPRSHRGRAPDLRLRAIALLLRATALRLRATAPRLQATDLRLRSIAAALRPPRDETM